MPLRSPSAFEHRLAERDADVLDGVVLIDVEVARGVQRQVEAAMPGEQLEHVVEEADAGANVVAALSVDRQRARDLRFRRLAVERRRALCSSRVPRRQRTDSERLDRRVRGVVDQARP